MAILQSIKERLAQTPFVRSALAQGADLEALRRGPTGRFYWGVALTALSWVVGVPLLAALGAIAVQSGEPMVLVIGAPAVLIFTHTIFFLGIWLAGGKHTMVLVRWALVKVFAQS